MENKDKIYSIEDLNINQNTMTCIFSKSNSGKTVLIRNLLEYLFNKYDFHSIIMFSDTAQYDDDYSFLNKKNIFTSDQIETKLKKILQLQKKNMLSNKDINLLLIFDDIKIHAKSKEIVNVASYGRHLNITTIISSQFSKGFTTSSLRSNITYLFFSDQNEIGERSIYECTSLKLSFRQFQEYINNNNNNYQFIFYDSKMSDKNNRLKIVKAKLIEKIKIKK